MRRIFTLIVAVIACASQMFAQLEIYHVEKIGTDQYTQLDEITGTTVNIQQGVEVNYYFKLRNVGSSEVVNLKAYLMLNDNDQAVNGTDANITLCTEPAGNCGVGVASPKFTLQPEEEQVIHMNIKTLASTDFILSLSVHQYGVSPEAIFNIHAGTTGISSIVANSFNVYPSPASESFTIENGFGKNSYVEIYNVLGQTVKRIPFDATSISVNCSSWKNGYYVCRLYKDGKAEKTVKIVVAH